MTQLEALVQAITNLCGKATYSQIYEPMQTKPIYDSGILNVYYVI